MRLEIFDVEHGQGALLTGDGKTATWREIGAAWPNKDGAGFNLSCSAVPLYGRIVLRAITELPASEEPAQ